MEHLQEQPGQGRQVGLPKRGEGVVVRVLIRREDPVGDLLVGGPLDRPGRGLPCAAAIEQELHQEGPVVGRLAAPVAGLVRRDDRGKIQRGLHDITEEQGQVPLREPVPEGRGQQEQLLGVVGLEGFHARDSIARVRWCGLEVMERVRILLRQAPRRE